MTNSSTTSELAADYLSHGWALVPIPHGGKAPTQAGWNQAPNCLTSSTPGALGRLNGGNVGLAHAYSGTCALDVDNYDGAQAGLAAAGIDLDALLAADDAVQIRSGREGHAKLLYRLPEGADEPPASCILFNRALELRCATRDGLTVQDVLPPSIHPDTGRPYTWAGLGDWRELPEIPAAVWALWRSHLVRRVPQAAEATQAEEASNLALDVAALGLHRHTLALIRDGAPRGQRSEAIYGVMKDLVRAGLADGQITHVLTDPKHKISEKAGELSRGQITSKAAWRWLDPQIRKARAEVAAERPMVVELDEVARKEDAAAQIRVAIGKLQADPGAVLAADIAPLWGLLNSEDPGEFERLRDQAKKAGARVAGIDKAAKDYTPCNPPHVRNNASYTSYTSSITKAYSPIDPTLEVYEVLDSGIQCQKGELVYVDDRGRNRTVIASKAAKLFQGRLRGYFAHNATAQSWHQFTGAHWAALGPGDGHLHRTITEVLYLATAPVGFSPRYEQEITRLLELGQMLPLPVPQPGAIPFRNGLLDIETKQLTPITMDNAQPWVLPYDYDPGATCPRVRAWLNDTVDGDSGSVELLRAWLAALISGRADLQRFLHLPGPGGSGKGTLMRLCSALVGEQNTASTDLRSLEQNRFETAALYGKRLVLITDSDRYGGSINTLKAITGQDPLRLERKHIQQAGTFTFGGLVMLASNEPLMTTDLTSGLERRRITVGFSRVASDAERERWRALGGEAAVLHSELPGVVNWALGLSPADVSQIITTPPERSLEHNLEAMAAGNPIVGWLLDCCAPDPGAWVQIGVKEESRTHDGRIVYDCADSKLYPNYLTWTRQNGREALSLRRFKSVVIDMTRTLGHEVLAPRRSVGNGIQGLRLLHHGEAKHPWKLGGSYTDSVFSAGSVVTVLDEIARKPLRQLVSVGSVGSEPNLSLETHTEGVYATGFEFQAPDPGIDEAPEWTEEEF